MQCNLVLWIFYHQFDYKEIEWKKEFLKNYIDAKRWIGINQFRRLKLVHVYPDLPYSGNHLIFVSTVLDKVHYALI